MQSDIVVMLSILLSIAPLLLLPTRFPIARAEEIHPGAKIHQSLTTNDYINCTVYEIGGLILQHNEKQKPEKKRFSCSTENFGPTILLEGDNHTFFTGYKDGKDVAIVSGVMSMMIPTNLVSARLSVDLDDPFVAQAITVSHEKQVDTVGQRKLNSNHDNKFIGSYNVLIIRVSDTYGNAPTFNANKIADSVFNRHASLANGYRTCSNNQLFFYATSGGTDIKNGVVDIVVDEDLSSSYDSTICVSAADSAISSLGYDLGNDYTYTMYICPDVVDFGQAVGVAQLGGTKSWYKDKWGSLPFVQMHEIGHNLMFFHSTEDSLEFGDPTGFMGGAFQHDRQDWGRICLNAAKTYLTQWYSQYHVNIDPTLDPYIGSLVDLNSVYQGNIRKHHQDDLVARIGSNHEGSALYFMLHRLEGITNDMASEYIPTHANRVNIVNQRFTKGVPSEAVAHLTSGEEYIQQDWAGTGKALHIKVCFIPHKSTEGGAKVIVYLEGENFVDCEMKVTNPPTMEVTDPPTASPSMKRCVDSPLRMILPNRTRRGCAWVANSIQSRCLVPGVASHCPLTCGTCIECVDSSRRFMMRFGEVKSCAWVKRKRTERRCAVEDVARTCHATCGRC